MNQRSKRTPTTIACLTGIALLLLSAGPATADVSGNVHRDGIDTGVTSVVLDRARNGLDLQTGAADNRLFEYTSVTSCPNNAPGGANADIPCVGAIQACAGNTPQQGQGPQVQLFRRQVSATGAPMEAWQPIGSTCLPNLVPGKRVLGMAQILQAFHNTPWAKPTVHIQPEGNVTLVTLTTYFEVTWPAVGYQPGEINATAMLGFEIRIRPTNQGYTYVFGDGASAGPVSSAGGVYPNGDITHMYAKAGVYSSHIDIRYGGEFSVNGGQWLPIPDTVTVAGSLQPLVVATARSRLVIK